MTKNPGSIVILAVDFDGILQAHIREQIENSLLGQLLDVKGGRLAVENDSFGKELNVEIAESAACSGSHMAFQVLAKLRIIGDHVTCSPAGPLCPTFGQECMHFG
jgi:hypothetical protein